MYGSMNIYHKVIIGEKHVREQLQVQLLTLQHSKQSSKRIKFVIFTEQQESMGINRKSTYGLICAQTEWNLENMLKTHLQNAPI